MSKFACRWTRVGIVIGLALLCMAAQPGKEPNKKQEVPANASSSPTINAENTNVSRTPGDSPTPTPAASPQSPVAPHEALNSTAGWASISGAVLTAVALIVAIMIYIG